MVSGLSYKKISVRRDVYEKLVELKEKQGFTSINDVISYLLAVGDIHATVSSMLEKYNATLSSMLEKHLATVGSMVSEAHATQSSMVDYGYATQSSMTAHSHATGSSMKTEQYATKGSKKRRVDEVLKDQKITCISELRKAGKTYPERIIEKAREAGAVKIDLGHDVCVVDPGFWWEFWKIVKGFKTPNDGENLKELKNEKMKWLYSELRKEGILVLDSSRKPPTWVVDKRVEIPEKAFEIGRTSQEEEESVGEDETVDEEYDYEDIYK